ncbi:MAG: HigA family addiction module antitoxin [Gammaproteobacteria bacterium]
MAKEYKAAGSAFAPTHPGELLREELLPAAGLTVAGAAHALGISRQTLHKILGEQRAVTPEMALRLGKLFGNGPELWLGMQQAHDLWRARQQLADILDGIETVEAV